MPVNKYVNAYFEHFISAFRRTITDSFGITICGVATYAEEMKSQIAEIITLYKKYDFTITFGKSAEDDSDISLRCYNVTNKSTIQCGFTLQGMSDMIELSSRTDVPVVCLFIMRAVAYILSKQKVLYKAIALDLDDTLWSGTLSEDGFTEIKKGLLSPGKATFIAFMRFLRVLSAEMGIFVAIISQNDSKEVKKAFDALDESEFPLKGQIDCLIANDNDKSSNIKLVAKELNILPEAIVFIDDNPIVRDSVKQQLPHVFVPEWNTHEEIVSLIRTSCCFEHAQFSINSLNRKRTMRIIKDMREAHRLPKLPVRILTDSSHKEAQTLYAKSNQFNFSQKNNCFDADTVSLYFEIFRSKGGESLGVCSSITYSVQTDTLIIHNWAISCRFFEIGLEEFVLLHIAKLSGSRQILILFNNSGNNKRTQELIEKYTEVFSTNNNNVFVELHFTHETEQRLRMNTKLIAYDNGW